MAFSSFTHNATSSFDPQLTSLESPPTSNTDAPSGELPRISSSSRPGFQFPTKDAKKESGTKSKHHSEGVHQNIDFNVSLDDDGDEKGNRRKESSSKNPQIVINMIDEEIVDLDTPHKDALGNGQGVDELDLHGSHSAPISRKNYFPKVRNADLDGTKVRLASSFDDSSGLLLPRSVSPVNLEEFVVFFIRINYVC